MKMRTLHRHPLISILSIPDVLNTIVDFGGDSCIVPILMLTINLTWRVDASGLPIVKWRGRKICMRKMAMEVTSIPLHRWYADCLSLHHVILDVPRDCQLHPYSPLNSLEDLDWYFKHKGVDWSQVVRGCCESEEKNHIDAMILAEHHGFIPLSSVPRRRLNIVSGAIGDRWDIVDKYVKRGDMDYDTYRHSIIWSISEG